MNYENHVKHLSASNNYLKMNLEYHKNRSTLKIFIIFYRFVVNQIHHYRLI